MKSGETKSRINFFERSLRLGRSGFSTKLKIKGQVHSLPRTFFPLFGVVVATMLILYGPAMESSVGYMLREGISELYDFKYEYVFTSVKAGAPLAGTEQFNATYVSFVDNEGISLYVTGLLPDTKMVRSKDTSEQSFQSDQITTTATLAQKLNIKVGDSVMVFDTGNGKKYTFIIEKMVDTYASNFLFPPLDRFNAGFGCSDGTYLGIWSGNAMAFVQGETQGTKSVDTAVAELDKMTDQMGPMIYDLVVFAFLLGLITLYIVTRLVVDEDRTSISFMKAFGYRKKKIGRLVLNSNALIVVLGYLLGVPAPLGTAGVFFDSLAESLQAVLSVKLNAVYMLFGFTAVMATYELAKWMCRKRAAHTPMSEASKAGTE